MKNRNCHLMSCKQTRRALNAKPSNLYFKLFEGSLKLVLKICARRKATRCFFEIKYEIEPLCEGHKLNYNVQMSKCFMAREANGLAGGEGRVEEGVEEAPVLVQHQARLHHEANPQAGETSLLV